MDLRQLNEHDPTLRLIGLAGSIPGIIAKIRVHAPPCLGGSTSTSRRFRAIIHFTQSGGALSPQTSYPQRHTAGAPAYRWMKTNAVHETFRMLPANSVAYRCNPPVFGRKSKNPPMAAHLRWAESMNDPQWGWRVAMTHHASEEPLPPSTWTKCLQQNACPIAPHWVAFGASTIHNTPRAGVSARCQSYSVSDGVGRRPCTVI